MIEQREMGVSLGEATYRRTLWTGLLVFALFDDETERWRLALVPPRCMPDWCKFAKQRLRGTLVPLESQGLLAVRPDVRPDVIVGPPTYENFTDALEVPSAWRRWRQRRWQWAARRAAARNPLLDHPERRP